MSDNQHDPATGKPISCGGRDDCLWMRQGLRACPEHQQHPARRGPGSGKALERGEREPISWYQVDPDTGCWLWKGSRGTTGYASTRYNGRAVGAHRAYYAHYVGPIPANTVVMHTCDRPHCVNPEHLRLGTPADNMRDMNAKGRTGGYRAQLGDQHKKAKLREADIPTIRARIGAGETNAAIAADYGVSATAIWQIKTGKAWKNA